MDWATLSEDMLVKIFGYLTYHERLTTVALVCQRWAEVSSNNNLDTCYVIKSGMAINKIIEVLIQAPYLRYLKLIDRTDLNSFLINVGNYNTRLKVLKFVNCSGGLNYEKITSENLSYVLNRCTLIETLKFEKTPYESRHFADSVTNLKNLRQISLVGNSYITSRVFIDSNSYVERDDVLTLVRECTNLQSIKLSQTGWDLDDEDIKIISENVGTRLKRLKVAAGELSDSAMDYLTTNNKNLSVFHFQNGNIKEESIVKLSNLPNLKSLGFTYCNSLCCMSFVNQEWAKNLKKIDLTSSDAVSDFVLFNLGRKCLELEMLNLCYCKTITAQGLEEVLKNCLKLRHLNISGVKDITFFFSSKCQLIAQHNKLQEIVYVTRDRDNELWDYDEMHIINYGLNVIRNTKPDFKFVYKLVSESF